MYGMESTKRASLFDAGVTIFISREFIVDIIGVFLIQNNFLLYFLWGFRGFITRVRKICKRINK